MNEVPAAPESPRLVLVTGVGRSGTSMMSGTLHHLGLDVPGPYLKTNESNPKGFFESRWAVHFHNRLAKAAGIYIFDARPEALGRVQAALTPGRRARLARFLGKHLDDERIVVVKDPRTVWTLRLWREEAAALGARTGYVAMLRHPAEVTASRSTYYAATSTAQQRHRYQVAGVTRWVNNTLISEAQTRGEPRAFVRYTDMLAGWRSVMRGVGSQLGIDYAVDLDAPNPADEFIDPSLRRHEGGWDELGLPSDLQSVAEDTWGAVQALVDDPASAAAQDRMDDCALAYRELVADASAMAQDWIHAARLEGRAAALAAPEPVHAQPVPLEQRRVQDVRVRQLLGVVATRGTQRLRRRATPPSP